MANRQTGIRKFSYASSVGVGPGKTNQKNKEKTKSVTLAQA